MRMLADGSYVIEDRVEIGGEGTSPFVFCDGWLVEVIEVEAGEFHFVSDGREVRPRSRRYGVFYPPFALVVSRVREMRGNVFGIGSLTLPGGLPGGAVMFETDFTGPFVSVEQAIEVVAAGTDKQSIEPNSRLSLLTLRAKRLIDGNYRAYPSIAKIAARLNVSHAHLSRQFKSDLGVPPSRYLHMLRSADASFRLSLGEEIVDISGEVGYNDLSRFYKQFKRSTGMPPAACRDTFND
jgi:AraC-like DNA-binding protein